MEDGGLCQVPGSGEQVPSGPLGVRAFLAGRQWRCTLSRARTLSALLALTAATPSIAFTLNTLSVVFNGFNLTKCWKVRQGFASYCLFSFAEAIAVLALVIFSNVSFHEYVLACAPSLRSWLGRLDPC